jgi:hypothetical protein
MENIYQPQSDNDVDTLLGVSNPLFAYIDSKDYDAIINEDNVPRTFRRGGIYLSALRARVM